ncbi:MAG TPA: protein kinase [Ktedonobacteraceae bacterium]
MATHVGKQLGNYRLSRLLGQGGFADVYLSEHIYLKTSAAIKVLQVHLTDDALNTFLEEARTIARLTHPHIIHVLEFGIEENTPFLVMNYAPYGSLRQRHPTGSILSSAQILSYVKQVASALHYAHERMIIHRDIKPENMLLGEAFTLMLSDFGLATTVQQQSQSVGNMPVHHTGSIAGTTTYMAPEQFDGAPSPASDQYALAVAVYEWFCGTPPFRGSALGVAVQHMQTPPPALRERLPGLSPAIEHVVMRALAKDPRARFPGVSDFASALADASRDGSGIGPLILPPMTSVPSGPQSPTPAGSRLHDYTSATVADHPFALGTLAHTPPNSRTGYPPSLGGTPAFPNVQPPRPISRRKVILGVASVAGGLTALGVGATFFARAHNNGSTPATHLRPSPTIAPTPTPNAEATAQATARTLVNAVESQPSLAALGTGHLDLFVRSDANTLWGRSYDGSWHDWTSLSGTFPYDPVAISWDGQRVDLFMRGADNTLQHRFYDGTWHEWESLGGSLASDPAVASWGPGRLDVFVQATDNALWIISYDGTWHPWGSLGGGINASPAAVSWAPNRLDAFARGGDNGLWHIWYDGAWHPWEPLGNSLTSAPAVTSWGPNRLDVFARGADASLQHIWYDSSTGAGWQPWTSVGGQMSVAPTAVSWGANRIDVVTRDPNKNLQRIWFDGNWQPWSAL